MDQCQARNGAVTANGRSISYADIVKRGDPRRSFTAQELEKLPIKPASERHLIGRKEDAIDIPAKTNGTARYGIDAAVEGMVYARPKIPPTRNGASVRSIDNSAARSVKGYLKCLALEDPSGTVLGWVMVFATSYPAAIRAADLVRVDWAPGDGANVSEQDILDHGAKQIADPKGGVLLVDDDGLDAAFHDAKSTLEQTYTTASVLHFQLEPVNALAFEKDGVFEIHTGSQWQSLILPVLAQALRLPQEKIVMRTYFLGGGFGRRLNGDYAVPAALAAQALGKPVKMVLTRPDDTRFNSFRSPSIQTLRMAFDADRKVTAMDHHASAGWPTQVMAPAFMEPGLNGLKYDPFAIWGANHWYDVGAQRLRALSNDVANTAFRPGWLRSVGSGWVNWGVEVLHGRGGPCCGRRSRRIPPEDARWERPQRRLGPLFRRRSKAPGGCSSARGPERRLGRSDAEGYGAWGRNHVWTGTRYADLGRLRGARAGRPRQRCGGR